MPHSQSPPIPRSIAAATARVRRGNPRGIWTLFLRGLLRFVKFATEGIGGALVSAMLFLAVFTFAWGGETDPVPGLSLPVFVAPGIAAFAMALNAYENAGFPVIYDKLEGIIGDVLMAPLTPAEILFGYVAGAAVGGFLTGAAVLAVLSIFVELPLPAPAWVVAFGLLGSLVFALAGFITGLWAEKWDRYSVVETFLILPLGLLSGTFFPIDALPPLGQEIIRANPVFYLIDGVRQGAIGHASADPWLGLAVLAALAAGLWLIAWRLVERGYKIKP